MRDLISLCIPCMNRTFDLRKVMPTLIAAANASPPVEIVVLDYNSQDDLVDYIASSKPFSALEPGNMITYRKYTGRDHYHMAHARNLSVLAAHGEYIIISSTDIRLDESFFQVIRENIEWSKPRWLCFEGEAGVLTIQREEFVAAGGFDERMEFYGSEDKDLYQRLIRRGGEYVTMPGKLFHANYTPDPVKLENYRERITKSEMDRRGKVYYQENITNHVLVANPEGWGAWN